MSFQDIGTETRQGNRGYVGQEAIRAIGESLQNYQVPRLFIFHKTKLEQIFHLDSSTVPSR